MPNGISFADEGGTLTHCALELSGEDGSLLLWEY